MMKEDYNSIIKKGREEEVLSQLEELKGSESLLLSIVKAMDKDDLADILSYIIETEDLRDFISPRNFK